MSKRIPKKMNNRISIWELIKTIVRFIIQRIRGVKAENQERFDKAQDNLKKEYDKIDKNKESQRNENTKKRLDNMF